jgi:predicted kinase
MNKSLKPVPQLKVMVGISGSGKTTESTRFISDNPNWVRVNRDDLRKQLLGKLTQSYYTTKQYINTEKHITNLQDEQIRYFLQQGYNVIVDNTHLKKQYLDHYISEFNHIADVRFNVVNTPLEECIERVTKREGAINTDYILRQHRNLNELLSNYSSFVYSVYNIKSNALDVVKPRTKCIIVDIDGTIADSDGRNPFDHSRVLQDKPIEATRQVVKSMKGSWLKRILNPITVVYLSGRGEICKQDTITWLKQNGFPYDGHLYMRADNDTRMDKYVKKELYSEHIEHRFQPLFVLDDRLQVCHMWYKLGLFVLNANQGLKHF